MAGQFMPQHDALLRRLDLVKDWASSSTRQHQTTLELQRARQLAQSQKDWTTQQLENAQAGRNAAYTQATQANTPGVRSRLPAGTNDFNRFLQAISGQESGGSYRAVNRNSGALGKYQIMPGNIPSWSRQALGKSISTSQFLNSPQLQEQIAQYHLKRYYDLYGPAGAAVAWYAGEGTAKKWVKSNGGAGYNKTQTYGSGSYPSINRYVNDILGRMRAI